MSYDVALNKSWNEIEKVSGSKLPMAVSFFSNEYAVELVGRKIFFDGWQYHCKGFISILILHYLKARLEGMPGPGGEWISFKELPGGDCYYPAFRKRAIEPLIRKYGKNPQGIYAALKRIQGRPVPQADAAIEVQAFENVPLLIEIWAGDDDLEPEANILFDKNVSGIFCTEDIAVISELAVKYV